MSATACRAFEERLVHEADLRRAAATLGLSDPHAVSCESCTALLDELSGEAALLRLLSRPEPSPALLARLSRIAAADLEVRRESAAVLDLLDCGMVRPEPAPELLSGLLAISRRPRNVVSFEEGAARLRSRTAPETRGLKRYVGDWRFAVAMAYAAAILIAAVLRIDPLSAARGTASNLTAAGERAIADARTAVGQSALAKAAVPLKERVDYRVYRTYAAGKARAVAYSQLVFEKVFGPTLTAEDQRRPEPREPRLRS